MKKGMMLTGIIAVIAIFAGQACAHFGMVIARREQKCDGDALIFSSI